ncbi:hypothetical protein V499_07276 [Pseudogymnoascus sp. VKM F-103]|nr:hypothetical protein V499_07276 [Pseudogymnoascus sp. VKM F-103]
MPPPHETLFFLTGGTGPRPTQAAFFAAAAQRTAKTQEIRREREMRKEKMREEKVQRDKALSDVPGLGARVMRLLGLRGLGGKGVRKGRGVEGGQVEKGGDASSGGGGDAGKDGGGISKGELPKDTPAIMEPEKGTVENDTVQSAGYDGGILSHGETCAGAHQGMPGLNLDGAGDDGHINIGEIPHRQHEEVEMLFDAEEVIAAGLKFDGDNNPEDIQPPIIVPAPSPDNDAKGGCDPGPNLLQVPPKDTQPELEIDINPDDIRQPTIVPAPDAGDNLDCNHNDRSAPLPALLKNTLPGSESDIKPGNIRPPIIVPEPDPGDSSDPIPSNHAPLESEGDLNSDDIKSPMLVPAPDPDDSAEGDVPKDEPAELESSINPDDIQAPIIVPTLDADDNANGSHNLPLEIPTNLPVVLTPHDADLDVQIQHDVRDPFSPTPHLPPPWEVTNIPYPHDGNDPFAPTPQHPRSWERPDEMFQAIHSSPPPQLGLITPSEASETPHPSLPILSPVSAEFGQRNTPSPHIDLPTPSFFLYEASSRASSRAPSVRDVIVEQSPVSSPAFERNGLDAHLVPLPASREPSVVGPVRSLGNHIPINDVESHGINSAEMRFAAGTEDVSHRVLTSKSSYTGNKMGNSVNGSYDQAITHPLPSREVAQQTMKWVRSGGGGWSGEWMRVIE